MSLVGDKIHKSLPGELAIGVISRNASMIGNGVWNHWDKKYMKDAFGAYLQEDYAVFSWQADEIIETEVEVQDFTEQTTTKMGVEMIGGVATIVERQVVTKELKYVSHEVFDAAGNPAMQAQEVNGASVMVPQLHFEPVMKTIIETTTKEVEHAYSEDELPDGLVVPAHAIREVQQRRVLNPDFDPTAPYTAREDRHEWDPVGLIGRMPVIKGEVTAPGWIKMRDVSADVEEWLIRA